MPARRPPLGAPNAASEPTGLPSVFTAIQEQLGLKLVWRVERGDQSARRTILSTCQFFRDAEAFAVLENEVIPKLFEGKEAGSQVRVGVGLTGDEAYSIAILLCEQASELWALK